MVTSWRERRTVGVGGAPRADAFPSAAEETREETRPVVARGGSGIDYSRRIDLAGQTVYDSGSGMNMTYDENGYAVMALNPSHFNFTGTDRSIRAPSAQAASAAASGAARAFAGSDYDLLHLTDNELTNIENMRAQARSGAITWQQANDYANSIRAKYGYSGGTDGSAYNKLPYFIFDPWNDATQPAAPNFGQGVKPSTNWTTQRNLWSEDYFKNGIRDAAPGSGTGTVPAAGDARVPAYTPAYHAPTGSDALVSQMLGLYGGNGAYAQAAAQERAANEAAVRRAISGLEAQKAEVNGGFAALYRQLYLDKMQGMKDLNQLLAAQGVTGGAAESTVLGLNTAYADALRESESERLGTVRELDRAIVDAVLAGDMKTAEAAARAARESADGYASLLRTLLERRDAQDARRETYAREDARRAAEWAREDARYAENRAREDAQTRQSAAYSEAMRLIGLGHMPDAATLSAAGIGEETARLLVRQAQDAREAAEKQAAEAAAKPRLTSAQVLSAIKNGIRTQEVLAAYQYWFGVPYRG